MRCAKSEGILDTGSASFSQAEKVEVSDARRPCGTLNEGRLRERARLPGLCTLVLLAGLALAVGGVQAHHTNPTCAAGGYTQIWNGTTVLPGISVISDECILVRGDIVLQNGSYARFRDTDLVFDNNDPAVGNITVSLWNDSIFEMTDADNDPATFQDRSGLLANDSNNLTYGFFFNVSVNASLYINDTIIRGGGLPGPGLNWRTGFWLEGLTDFAWNRVDHTFLANGLMLVNFTKARTVKDPGFTAFGPGAGYGLYLSGVANLSVQSLTVKSMPFGVLINDSRNIAIRWFNSTAGAIGLTANRVSTLVIQDVLDNSSRTLAMDFNSVTNLTLRRAQFLPALANNSAYGIELEASRDILLRDIEMSNFATANIHIWQGTQNLWAENISLRGSTAQASSRGIWAVEAADIFRQSNFTFVSLTVFGRNEGVNLTGVGLALFSQANISATISYALYTAQCFDVEMTDSNLTGSAGTGIGFGAYLGGSNLTLQRLLIQGYAGPGVVFSDGSFTVEAVTLAGNGRSIRSFGTARIGPSVIANSTIPAGSAADAVNLVGYDTTSFTRLLVFGNNFTSPCATCYGLRLDTFGRVDVINNTFFALPVAVSRSGTLVMSGNTHRVSQLPANAVVILFDNGTTLSVSRDVFQAPSMPAGISTVIRAPTLAASVTLEDMRLPVADFGVWVSANQASSLLTTVDLHNITAYARRDAVSSLFMNTVRIDNLTVDASTNGVIIYGFGNAQDFSLRDCMLGATGTAINMTLDSAGRALVTDIAINASPSRPGRALSIQGGSVATVARIGLEGVASGIVTSDLRRLNLGNQNFTNNSVGLRMDSPTVTTVDLNWTVSAPTRVENTYLRFGGAVSVSSASLTLRNASLSLYALGSDPRITRFFFQGASVLTLTDGSSIVTEPASGRNADSRFTLQLSAASRVMLSSAAPWGRVLLESLGDPDSAVPTEQGILIRAQDTAVVNVTFVNFTRALMAQGVNLTVANCTFTGGPRSSAAVTVSGAGFARVSFVDVVSADGVEASGSRAAIDNSTFRLGGFVLSLTNSQGWLSDSTVEFTSTVVLAESNSAAELRHIVVRSTLDTSFWANGTSTITVKDSGFFDVASATDAKAYNGAWVTFNNSFIDRFASPDHKYRTETIPGGTVDVFWDVRFAVCVLSSSENVTGADVTIYNRSNSIIFTDTTGASGYTALLPFLEYHARDGIESYATPARMVGALGPLVNDSVFHLRNEGVIQVCVDDVPPVITVLTVGPPGTSESFFSLSVLVTDEDSGLQIGSPCVAFSGDPGQACVPKGENRILKSIKVTVNKTLQEGANWFRIEAVDLFGNTAVAWANRTLDQTGPVITSCVPGFDFRTRNESVDLVCEVEGDPANATFQGLIPDAWHLDNGTLHAAFHLREGTKVLTVNVIDALGNYNGQQFNWTLDTTAPTITLRTDLSQVVNQEQVLINGSIPIDTVSLTVDGRAVNFTGTRFSFLLPLTHDGVTTATLVSIDIVGNRFERTINLTRDMTTNCTLTTPTKGMQTGETPVLVSGRCDPDVSILVNGDVPAPVGRDGLWSVRVSLVSGANKITIQGTDVNGASWYDEVQVYYEPGSGPTGVGLLLVFALLAAGVLIAAFYISRRPRDDEHEPAYRLAAGAQKAPPRPKPQTLKLPEMPGDLTYQPKPPTPPPPPPPPPPRKPGP